MLIWPIEVIKRRTKENRRIFWCIQLLVLSLRREKSNHPPLGFFCYSDRKSPSKWWINKGSALSLYILKKRASANVKQCSLRKYLILIVFLLMLRLLTTFLASDHETSTSVNFESKHHLELRAKGLYFVL